MDVERARLGSVIYEKLSVLQASMRAALSDAARQFSPQLSLNERAILRHLSRPGAALSLSSIAGVLGATRALARQTIKRLSENGLVQSVEDPGDRRARLWQATEHGTDLMEHTTGRLPLDLPVVAAFKALPSADLRRFVDQLNELVASVAQPATPHTNSDDGVENPEDVASFEVFFDVWLIVARAYRNIRAEQTRFLLDATAQVVDTPAYMALYRVHERSSTIAEIAAFLRVDLNTAGRLIDRLERSELVARARNPSSRREKTISATEKGSRILGTVPPVDPAGAYLAALQRLHRGGGDLEDILQRATAGFVDHTAIDHQVFYALLKSVSEHVPDGGRAKVDGRHFRSAMSQFLTGVAVVTVGNMDAPRAITVNSLTSVSLDPPILLVCFDRRSPSLGALLQRKSFGISILGEDQQHLADRFGRRETEQNPHTVGPETCSDLGGVPLLAGSLAQIVCDLEQSMEAGSHTVIFGSPRLIALREPSSDVDALGYWRSQYVQVGRRLSG